MNNPLARMPNGSWIRTRMEEECIIVEVQEQWKRDGCWVICCGADGQERWRRLLGDIPGSPEWVSIGKIALTQEWECFMSPALVWQNLVQAVQRHVVALIAAGWGESDQEIIDAFAKPLELRCFPIGQVYKIIGSQEPLIGLEQHYIEMQDDGEDKLFLRFLGTEMPVVYLEVEVTEEETAAQAEQRQERIQMWVRALFLATHPLVSRRG